MILEAIKIKAREIAALGRAKNEKPNSLESYYFNGKAAAFAEVWELLVFGGSTPTPDMYNKMNEEHSNFIRGS